MNLGPTGVKTLFRQNLVTSLAKYVVGGAVGFLGITFGMYLWEQQLEGEAEEKQRQLVQFASKLQLSHAIDIRNAYHAAVNSTTDDEVEIIRSTLEMLASEPEIVPPIPATPYDPFHKVLFRRDSTVVPSGIPWSQIIRQFVLLGSDLPVNHAKYSDILPEGYERFIPENYPEWLALPEWLSSRLYPADDTAEVATADVATPEEVTAEVAASDEETEVAASEVEEPAVAVVSMPEESNEGENRVDSAE